MLDYSRAEQFLIEKYEVEDITELEYEYFPGDVIGSLVSERFGTKVECADFYDDYIAYMDYENVCRIEIVGTYLYVYLLTGEEIFETWLELGSILYAMSKDKEIYHKLIDPLLSSYDVRDLEDYMTIEDDFKREVYKSLDHRIEKMEFLIKNGEVDNKYK